MYPKLAVFIFYFRDAKSTLGVERPSFIDVQVAPIRIEPALLSLLNQDALTLSAGGRSVECRCHNNVNAFGRR